MTLRRTGIRQRRATPRRREAPRWAAAEWEEATRTLYRRSGGRCECCGRPFTGDEERSHRVRRRDGGDRLSNILLLRRACHAHWTHNPSAARQAGVILRTTDDPLTTPVMLRGTEEVWLDDLGNLLRPR